MVFLVLLLEVFVEYPVYPIELALNFLNFLGYWLGNLSFRHQSDLEPILFSVILVRIVSQENITDK